MKQPKCKCGAPRVHPLHVLDKDGYPIIAGSGHAYDAGDDPMSGFPFMPQDQLAPEIHVVERGGYRFTSDKVMQKMVDGRMVIIDGKPVPQRKRKLLAR